jgi:hypothetical protein
MANNAEFKLKYTIESDNSKAKKDVQEVDTLITKLFGKKTSSSGLQSSFKEVASEVSNIVSELTGDRLSGAASQVTSLANAFGAIPGPAGLAVGAIAGIGTAAVGAGAALFELTEKSAAYGESIYNAQVKTGLHAETLSAMQLAAKQSGVEFDQVTSSIQKFAQTVGQAAEGSDKAGKSLTALGLDPKKAADNLTDSLGKVLKKIADAPTIVEKNTLALQAFGKQGKDLVTFIERFHGDLPALTEELEKMGVTISDKDALAAHAFGEEMSLVTDQIEKAAIKIGTAFMPAFYRMATGLSEFIAKNQGEISHWADEFAFAFDRIVKGAGTVITALENYYRGYKAFMDGIGLGFLVPKPFLLNALNADYNADFNSRAHESAGFAPGLPTGGLPDIYGKAKKPPKESDDQFRKFFTDQGFTVTRTFGNELNKGSLHPLGLAADVSVRGKTEDEIAKLIEASIEKGYRLVDERKKIPGIFQTGPHLHFERNGSEKASIFQDAGAYGSVPLGYLQQLDKARLGKGPGGSTAITEFNKKELDLDIKGFETYWNRKLEIEQAGNNNLIALKEVEMDAIKQSGADYVTATQKASELETLKLQQYQEEIDYLTKLEDYYRLKASLTTDQVLKTDLLSKADETHQKIELKTIDIQTQKIKLDQEEKDSVKALTDKYYDFGKSIEDVAKAREDFEKQTNGGVTPGVNQVAGTGAGKDIRDINFDAFGELRKQFTDQGSAKMVAGVDLVTSAFQNLGDAVGSAVEAFVLYGNAGQTVQQVTAQILGAIAKQAAVQAVYELAQGFAMLALSFFGFTAPAAAPSAAYHFASAAVFAGIAGGAALAGRAVAGNSFKSGAGAKGGGGPSQLGVKGSSAYSYNGTNANQNPTPYSRTSLTTYDSGNRQARMVADAIAEHTETLKKIDARIGAMKPGDVLTRGIDQRPGVVGHAVTKDIQKNSAIGTNILKASGVRR